MADIWLHNSMTEIDLAVIADHRLNMSNDIAKN